VVLERFIDWLKPNGILILRIPNRDSVIGFITRITPFWLHVAYKKHIGKHPYAGKPGHDPFPTFFDRVVSEEGIYDFCETHNLTVKAYYYHSWYKKPGFQPSRFLSRVLVQIVHVLSFKRLTNTRESLIWIIEKPAS
jgi:hypothetical protein